MDLYTNDEVCIIRRVAELIEQKRAFNLNMVVDKDGDLNFILHTLERPAIDTEDKE